MNLPDKKYNIIYADPPWRYKCWGRQDTNKSVKTVPYSTMSDVDIYNLPVQDICEKDCILFLWATYPLLPQAIKTMEKWGFVYKTVAFTWVKQNKKSDSYFFGLGHWTRANPEICLLGTKGNIKRESKKVANLVVSRIEAHSKKPAIVRDRIVELIGDLPRIELFARQEVEGWYAWGNEIKGELK